MARNSEKAQSMLYRFRESQAAELGIIDAGRTRRPKVISDQTSIPACERWRGQVLKEISRKVSKIQDVSLSDFQVRDLNDEINKLLREKYVWEVQIRNLGGPNYSRTSTDSGKSGRGYQYFGRARELPGVRELFAQAKKPRSGDQKQDQEKQYQRVFVDAAYYGYEDENDEDDGGALINYEARREAAAQRKLGDDASNNNNNKPPPDWEPLPGDTGDGQTWTVPTVDQVQEELLARRKQRILDQLA